MDLQLNAVEDEPASPPPSPSPLPAIAVPVARSPGSNGRGGHARPPPGGSLASLLSANSPVPPRSPAAAAATHAASPVSEPPLVTDAPMDMDDAPTDKIAAPSPSVITLNVSSPATVDDDDVAGGLLATPRLRELRDALGVYHAAVAGMGTEPPPPKRRKGKHQRRRASSTATAATAVGVGATDVPTWAAVERGLEALDDRLAVIVDDDDHAPEAAATRRALVREVCGLLGGALTAAPLAQSSTVPGTASPEPPALESCLGDLAARPAHSGLVHVLARAVLDQGQGDRDHTHGLLTEILDWCEEHGPPRPETTTTTPPLASWLLAAIAEGGNAPVVMEFIILRRIRRRRGPKDDDGAARTAIALEGALAYVLQQFPTAMAHVLERVLDALTASRDRAELVPLIDLVRRTPRLAEELDRGFQWLLTKPRVSSLWGALADPSAGGDAAKKHNGNPTTSTSATISAMLLQLIDERGPELPSACFHLLLLLHDLMASTPLSVPEALMQQARAFHAELVELAERQVNATFVKHIHRHLPFIINTVVAGYGDREDESSRTESPALITSWSVWLEIISKRLSSDEVATKLIEADLMACEVMDEQRTPLRAKELATLLRSVAGSSSAQYVVFLRKLGRMCEETKSSKCERRLLSLLAEMQEPGGISQDDTDLQPLQLQLSMLRVDEVFAALSSKTPWHRNWEELERSLVTSGAHMWEHLVDLLTSKDSATVATAIDMIAKTPFPSLEDPVWQYRCLRKLVLGYHHCLQRYRVSIVYKMEADDSTKRLESLRMLIFRVICVEGAVAHYGSSVYTQFASLWLDAMFSAHAPSSVPTHFPAPPKDHDDNAPTEKVVIRSERTISSKCTNLQSSQIITKQHTNALVYRKALDETWEQEMDAALTCSQIATEVLESTLLTTVPLNLTASLELDEERRERRLKVLVDLLLERAIPCCGLPSDDAYKELLPNRSSFDVDLRIEQWLNHFPSFLMLVRIIIAECASSGSVQSLRLLPLIKSALVVCVGHWNSVNGELDVENLDVPPYMRNRNQLSLSCELVRVLRLAGWIPTPLGKTAELLPMTTPEDVRSILFSCWFYLADHPPSTTDLDISSPLHSGTATGAPKQIPIEFYLIPIRRALHRNIHRIGSKYCQFMC